MVALRALATAGVCHHVANAIHSVARDEASTLSMPDKYREYRNTFGHRDGSDSVSYEERLALFEQRVEEIEAHNSADATWKETVNEYADATHNELNALLGYRRVGSRWYSEGSFIELGESLNESLSTEEEFEPVNGLSHDASKDWRPKLKQSMTFFRNQGACGSCWAVAAAGAIEMHAEINSGSSARISHIQLVNCVPNPKHCGGSGGCHGATAELAYEYVAAHGVVAENDKAFTSQHGTCKKPDGDAVIEMTGHKTLPVNKLQPLLTALMHSGPAAVSVDGAKWSFYHSGVFAGCKQDTVVNHAVLLIGFGFDSSSGKKYWHIRNSWGPRWGESGLMRIERHGGDSGDAGYCGWDNKPKDGVFCDDAPEKVPVCGMCGILSDSAIPTGVKMVKK